MLKFCTGNHWKMSQESSKMVNGYNVYSILLQVTVSKPPRYPMYNLYRIQLWSLTARQKTKFQNDGWKMIRLPFGARSLFKGIYPHEN